MSLKILVVDDNIMNVRLMIQILEDEGYDVESTDDGSTVLKIAAEVKPDIILLDIMMPGVDGFEVCRQLKKDFDLKDIPVIMITAKSEGPDVKKALELGAFDYVKKPVDEVEIIARIQSAMRFVEQQNRLKEMAMRDGLTGVYNHALLMDLFEKEYSKHVRLKNNVAFIMVDIDYFKKVNDTYGHMAGDTILRELSSILVETVRREDIVGRYGGEEFSIILPDITREGAYIACERIRKKVEDFNFNREDKSIHVTISMGICFKSCEDKFASSDMVKYADDALYKAKREGRNRVEMYKMCE